MMRTPDNGDINNAKYFVAQRAGLNVNDTWTILWSPLRDFAFTAAGDAITKNGGAWYEDIAFVPRADDMDLEQLELKIL